MASAAALIGNTPGPRHSQAERLRRQRYCDLSYGISERNCAAPCAAAENGL